jgi:hypothetical protein
MIAKASLCLLSLIFRQVLGLLLLMGRAWSMTWSARASRANSAPATTSSDRSGWGRPVHFRADEQPSVFAQAVSLQRGETAATTGGERPGCPPKHTESRACREGDPTARTSAAPASSVPASDAWIGVGKNQREVDVADQRAEPAMGETAQGVGREEPCTRALAGDADRVGENILAGGTIAPAHRRDRQHVVMST